MKSTRYRNPHISKEQVAAEMRARGAVRRHLRTNYPDIPRPVGGNWLFASIDWPCIFCEEFLVAVSVPAVHAPDLAFCPHCFRVYEGSFRN